MEVEPREQIEIDSLNEVVVKIIWWRDKKNENGFKAIRLYT